MSICSNWLIANFLILSRMQLSNLGRKAKRFSIQLVKILSIGDLESPIL